MTKQTLDTTISHSVPSNHPLVRKLAVPIQISNIAEFGIDVTAFCKRLIPLFNQLPEDGYVKRQKQIEFLQALSGHYPNLDKDKQFWMDFYSGSLDKAAIESLLFSLSPEIKQRFNMIHASRFRTASEFDLTFENGDWLIERVVLKHFIQEQALIDSVNRIDFRQLPRQFVESSDDMIDSDLFKILKHCANLIQSNTHANHINVVVHHTKVTTSECFDSSNSPEGIHQDGMDYIISALVVERFNINGAKSVIFGQDKTSKIVEKTLLAGDFIFQPDKNTDLWHTVEPISAIEPSTLGSRSTIGFDFSVIH